MSASLVGSEMCIRDSSSAEKRLPVTRPAARPTASASTAPPARTKQCVAASAARLTIRSLQPGSLA
eukprot:9553303-Alexandrium_andersonii.AAC.1